MGGGMTRMADTNNDGSITRAEFEAAALKHFATADANSDGQVTREERQAAHAKMRAAHQGQGATAQAPAGDDND
jgi:Ca2+-binding EF-hand superfamily protein